MKAREAEAALWAANPIGRTEVMELRLEVGEGEMLEAIAAEPAGADSAPVPAGTHGLLRANPRLATALAILAALVVFITFTSPGHAVAGWVGQQLGLSGPGEPGGPPTLRQLRQGWTKGTSAEGQPAHVLVVGPAPHGDRYEFITFRTKDQPGMQWPANGESCFEIDITVARGSYNAGCGILRGDPNLQGIGPSGSSGPDRELFFYAGLVSESVESVEVSFEGRPLEVQLTPVPEELIEGLRLAKPFQFFIAFFDDAPGGGEGKLVARDAGGEVLSRRRFEVFDLGLFPR